MFHDDDTSSYESSSQLMLWAMAMDGEIPMPSPEKARHLISSYHIQASWLPSFQRKCTKFRRSVSQVDTRSTLFPKSSYAVPSYTICSDINSTLSVQSNRIPSPSCCHHVIFELVQSVPSFPSFPFKLIPWCYFRTIVDACFSLIKSNQLCAYFLIFKLSSRRSLPIPSTEWQRWKDSLRSRWAWNSPTKRIQSN